MQTRELVSLGKAFFRDLRRNHEKNISQIRSEVGIAYPTIKYNWDKLFTNGPLLDTGKNKFVINSDYQSFAGIYVSKDTIDLSVIDFSGKEIKYMSKKYNGNYIFYEVLQEIFLSLDSSVEAVAICSDEYLEGTKPPKINELIWVNDSFIKEKLPESIEYYFEKTCVTNSFKWYEDSANDELNVIFSLSEQNSFYTIMKNGVIVQKRITYGLCEDFYEKVIKPVWQSINPNNMVFVNFSNMKSDVLESYISEWQNKIRISHLNLNKDFETREYTNLICFDKFHKSKGSALYALYTYYGWTD